MILGGEISYGIYLLHDGVQRYSRVGFERVFHSPLKEASMTSKLAFMVLTSILAVALAYVSWSKLEGPARRIIRDRLKTHD
jgi:peptidoglycan/LPS O-acetylase OafA/YrhL